MIKKSLSVLLVIVMIATLFTIVPITAAAEETYTSGDYSYVLVTEDDVTTAGITAYTGSEANLTIPDTLNGYNVNVIRQSAFAYNTTLTKVTFPNTVTSIGHYAFQGCTNLEEVTLSDTLEDIGYSSFYNCTALSQIVIPNSVTFIGNYAFAYCSTLSSEA